MAHKVFEKIAYLYAEKRGLVIFACILLAVIIIAAIIIATYVCRVYHIRTYGIALRPSRDFAVHDIQYYLQNDAEWSNDQIGNSNSRLGAEGCLIACISSAITDMGIPVNPRQLNQKLTEAGGFQVASLIWYKINEACPEVDYRYTRAFSSATMERDMKSGLLPIIRVKYRGSGIDHWLLIVGAKDGEFLVFDPLNSEKKPINLSVHGRVYTYRVLVPSGAR